MIEQPTEAVLEADSLWLDVEVAPGRVLTLARGIDLTVRAGESVALVGRSGSGKSTLLAAFGLLRRPDRGRVVVDGQDAAELSDARAAMLRNQRIGFVFQDYSLVGHLSVVDNVMLPFEYGRPAPRRRARDRAVEQLDAVGLAGFEGRRPAQLSGGEQQRVAIARALVREPALVLADEPTGALDTDTGDAVIENLLEATRRAGVAAVVVTHDPALAARMDRSFELVDGHLLTRDGHGHAQRDRRSDGQVPA
ncbi:ABC transporter ATP-binding protein [Cellulomonas bogoriensis]|uniref:ABC transporter ATP-binding protein n=1 Tax=Cellulomonas bogoriensis 69B4 = DSM 16987 TaxID=1386082 RepID=A0A0A0C2U4_9CELL|nr:ABC transporter ATP-binding protein [Cellulomonas bogoriensis]KGM14520.1 ABC transporter ATP-binding protein [Cellulomonas bogoriensis 69B4 = DSM 16987]